VTGFGYTADRRDIKVVVRLDTQWGGFLFGSVGHAVGCEKWKLIMRPYIYFPGSKTVLSVPPSVVCVVRKTGIGRLEGRDANSGTLFIIQRPCRYFPSDVRDAQRRERIRTDVVGLRRVRENRNRRYSRARKKRANARTVNLWAGVCKR